ncbi:hypothetical protein OYC64_017257 [Pagothenia borchgrevinki]|uniref:Uncharacterized protein n=1 Tax=Pagothenia borchgrevinki TaxID=8213 RepID=A0ABD2HM08_PAGBO
MHSLCRVKMQFRTVLDVKVVDVQKRRNPSKHYVSCLPAYHLIPTLSHSEVSAVSLACSQPQRDT